MKKYSVNYFNGLNIVKEIIEGEGALKGINEKIKINRWELIKTVEIKRRGRKSKIEKG
jgi:hypothetical protein